MVVVAEMSFASIDEEPLRHLSTADQHFCNTPVSPATLVIHESACFACHISTFRNMPESCVWTEWLRVTTVGSLWQSPVGRAGCWVCTVIRAYLVRCSWRSASPSSSVTRRHSCLARAAFCRSCSTRCSLPLSSSLSFSISLCRQREEKNPY